MADYPTEEELDKIRNWDILEESTKGLVDYIESIWWAPDWGFKIRRGYSSFPLTRKQVVKLELHTGGWSGNESIIEALQQNFFWFLYWEKSTRGGHFWFEIDLAKWKRGDKDA